MHAHDHSHDHDHPHDHDHDHHTEAHRPHEEPVVLEIGGELGALVVYTDPSLLHTEIEISPAGRRRRPQPQGRARARRRRAVDLRRRVRQDPGRLVHALARRTAITRGAAIAAGLIAELDWTAGPVISLSRS